MAIILMLLWLQPDETALRSAVARDARDADARYRLGLVLFKQRKLDESARYLDEAAKIEPQQALIWRALALVRGARRDGLGEARALQKIVELDPADIGVYRKLAALLLDHRTADGALAMADAGLKRSGSDAELLRLRGLALYALGRKPEAIDAFLAMPDSDVALASIETLIPDAGGRLAAIQARLRKMPASALVHYLLALTGDDAEARLRKAIAAAAGFWPAHYELGRRLGDIELLETALKLNPAHEGAHFTLSLLYAERGEREKARAHREAHHKLRAEAAEAEQKRAETMPRMQVTVR